jgi:hypothetical protein
MTDLVTTDVTRNRPRRTRPVALFLAIALAACNGLEAERPPSAAPSIAAREDPAPELTPTPPALSGAKRLGSAPEAAPLAAFAMNLYHEGDFVPQHTFEWCVAASMQMTLNMIEDPNRSSAEDQGALWERARSRASDRWGGASGRGWAAVLNEMGVGPYELTSFRDYEETLRMAAAAIRETERPVGLIMWRGRHAWVMSGFESMGDPAVDKDFSVTGIHVLDPLYPHGDDAWGPSPVPNALLTPDELARQFVSRDIRSWGPDSPTGYVLILPREESGA